MGKGENRTLISKREFLSLLAKGITIGTGLYVTSSFLPSGCFSSSLNTAPEWRNKKSSMGYRRLGKTNIMVSEISFGCAINYGCNAVGNRLTDSVRGLYDTAFEMGINFFDTTADHAGGYTREECFQHFRPVRDKVFLATKVNDFEPKAVRASIERSLKRMKTDYIDIVFLHNMVNRGGWKMGAPALAEIRGMVHEGKVRFAGVSDHSYSNLMKTGDHKDSVDVILLKYSVKRKDTAEAVIAHAKSSDIGVLAMKVFDGADDCWSGKAPLWENDKKLQSLMTTGITLPQAAIRSVLNNKNVSTALIGMRSKTEIMENVSVSLRTSSRESYRGAVLTA